MKPHTNHSSTTEGKCVSVFSFYLSFSISLMPFIPSPLYYFSAFQLVSFLISLCNFLFVPIDLPSYLWVLAFSFSSPVVHLLCFLSFSFLFQWSFFPLHLGHHPCVSRWCSSRILQTEGETQSGLLLYFLMFCHWLFDQMHWKQCLTFSNLILHLILSLISKTHPVTYVPPSHCFSCFLLPRPDPLS